MKIKSKILNVSFLVLLLCSFVAKADKPRAKGYYLDKAGNKIVGMVEVNTQLLKKDVSNVQVQHATFYDKRGKEIKLTEEIANEFGFNYQNEDLVFRLLPEVVQKTTMIKANFYKVLLEGTCSIYLAYLPNNGTYMLQYLLYKDENHYYLTTEGAPNFRLSNGAGRIKSLTTFFEDCPDLVAKIENKEYKKGDDNYIRMVQYYNTTCNGGAGERTEETEN